MRRALVIGGSVGGLMTANLLRSVGWDVSVFERATGNLSTRGAGLGTSQELVDVMQRIGARFDASAGILNSTYVWMRADGRIAYEHARANISSAWQRVYVPLRAVTPDSIYRQGMTLARVEQDDACVTAVFADGQRESGSLLVAADGALSTVRAQFLPDVKPHYANYVAWRGIAEERDVPQWAREAIAGRVVNAFPEGEHVLTLAVPGADEDTRSGHRRIYVIWYRPAAQDLLRDLFTDSSGTYHGLAIAPGLIRRDIIEELRRSAAQVLPPAIQEVVKASPQFLLQAINDIESPQMTFGRVALLGDSAFVARPHSAAGVSKAALDAQCLADELVGSGHGVAAALQAYNAKRTVFGASLVAHARYLGTYLEGQTKPEHARTALERERDPAQLIRDYGAPHLLRDVGAVGLRQGADRLPDVPRF